MPNVLAADYSTARPTPAQLAAAGYKLALRYLSHEPAKNLTVVERDELHAAGLAVGLVWETSANRTLGGEVAGRADALEANAQADALGFPKDRAIYYAVDFDASAGQISGPITSYFNGVNSVGGRPRGVYGTYRVIEGLVGGGLVAWGWQCAAWSGFGTGSGGSIQSGYAQPVRLSQHACLFQHYGLTGPFGNAIDRNDVLMDPTPWSWPPNTQPPSEEDDMINWRPFRCPQTGGQEWLLQPADGGGFYRYALADGEAQDLWGQGYIQTIAPFDYDAAAGQRILDRYPAAAKPAPLDPAAVVAGLRQPLTDAVTAALQGLHVDVDGHAVAEAVVAELHDRLAS